MYGCFGQYFRLCPKFSNNQYETLLEFKIKQTSFNYIYLCLSKVKHHLRSSIYMYLTFLGDSKIIILFFSFRLMFEELLHQNYYYNFRYNYISVYIIYFYYLYNNIIWRKDAMKKMYFMNTWIHIYFDLLELNAELSYN